MRFQGIEVGIGGISSWEIRATEGSGKPRFTADEFIESCRWPAD